MAAHRQRRDAYYTDSDEHDFSTTHIQQSTQLDGHLRPSSIDMSLELERQLDAEHDHDLLDADGAKNSSLALKSRPISLDPLVLSSIVAGLRENLAEMTKERDGLVETLSEAHTREAELKEALALVTERSSALEVEVAELKKKSQDDEDAIQMLRTKVEESRRGLMRLQTESKRMSQISNLSLDTGRANSFFANAPPSANRRTSFTPLTGSNAARMSPHRRTASVSDSAFAFIPASAATLAEDAFAEQVSGLGLGLASNPRSISLPEDATEEKKARRTSGLFSRTKSSPSPPTISHFLPPEHLLAPGQTDSATLLAQLDALKKERDAARSELENTRHELLETQEAREASEHCVHALRTFISEHAVGESVNMASKPGKSTGLKLPPLPTDKNADLFEEAEPRRSLTGSGGWSLGKLWRTDSSGAPSSSISPSSETAPAPSSATPGVAAASPAAAPATGSSISRKLTGFFSSRASVSSATSGVSGNPRETIMNGLGSDCSSIDEPLEPASPAHELAGPSLNIMVHEASRSALTSGEEMQPVIEPSAKELPVETERIDGTA